MGPEGPHLTSPNPSLLHLALALFVCGFWLVFLPSFPAILEGLGFLFGLCLDFVFCACCVLHLSLFLLVIHVFLFFELLFPQQQQRDQRKFLLQNMICFFFS